MLVPLSLPFFRVDVIHIVGPLKFEPFGGLLALSFLIASLIAQRYARKRGTDPAPYADLIIWMAVSGVLFAHLGHIAYEPAMYREDPMKLFRVWEGLASIGGYFGCTAVAVWFFKRRGLDPLKGGDLMMIGFALGIFIGRAGCFVVHDHIGKEVEDSPAWAQTLLGPLAVEFPDAARAEAKGREAIAAGDEGAIKEYEYMLERGARYCCADEGSTRRCACTEEQSLQLTGSWVEYVPFGAIGTTRYDLGLMDGLLGLFIFFVLVLMARKPRREGVLLATLPLIYAPVRLVWDALRNTDLGGEVQDARYLGLTPAQFGSIVLFGLGLWVLSMSRKRPVWPAPGTKPWSDETPATPSPRRRG
ncbi:MAG: hypothetical protein GY898_31870 [Proteobacteria bacterium]|nr:hypothetical protein [Pseudomonadota bacterium]